MDDFSTKTCVFVGRFQPFHMGHLMVVQGMAQLCGRVKIVVGSTQEEGTKENPFSFDERREMIQRPLQDLNLIPQKDISIFRCDDVPSDDEWITHMKAEAGDFDAIWTGNEHVKELAEAAGIPVKWVKEVPGISATTIREKIKAGDTTWKEHVHDEVRMYLQSIRADERLK